MFTVVLAFVLLSPGSEEPNGLEVIQRAQQQAGTRLVSDATLTRGAKCLANAAKLGRRLDTALIRHCSDVAEIYDGVLVPLLGEAGPTTDLLASLVPYFKDEAKKRGLTHYGAANITDGQRRILAVIATLRRGTLQVNVDCKAKRMKIAATLEPGNKNPRAFITDTRGLVGPVPLTAMTADAPFPVVGRYQVEVLADGSDGPHVIANRAVFACVPKPQTALPTTAPPTQDPPERRLFTLINDARKVAGAPLLTAHEGAAKVARAHAEDMKKQSYFAHSSKDGRTLGDRLKAAGVPYNRAAENLSAAPNADDAHYSLMASPGHRKNTVDPELTHVGIGVVSSPLSNGEESYLFVVDFLTPPKSTTAEGFAEEVLTALNQLRAQNGAKPLQSDARLKRIAIEHSAAMARKNKLAYQPSFDEARADGIEIDSDLFMTADVETVKKSANAQKPASKIAIGVAQKDGMFYVTVIYVRSSP